MGSRGYASASQPSLAKREKSVAPGMGWFSASELVCLTFAFSLANPPRPGEISKAMDRAVETTVCIAGGGPAGMMLGYLLARAGIDVVVLEKHADFLRDFRGDTVHPSTLQVMHELGLLEDFLKRPHQEVRELTGLIGDFKVRIADFTHLKLKCPFVAFMPQWDFLDFLASRARAFPSFHLMMQSEATDLIVEDGRIAGVQVRGTGGAFSVRAKLTIGADGRHSIVRERAGLPVDDIGAPIDVFWLRLSKKPGDATTALGRIAAGHVFVMLDRGDYWQCGFLIAKGGAAVVQATGLPTFRATIAEVMPMVADRVDELKTWDDVKLLSVAIDRLRQWCKPGLLCIGDAAHAMSPVGGVGINLAIQDAVAAANILSAPLLVGTCTLDDLYRVQKRREWPTRLTQGLQVIIQNRILTRVLKMTRTPKPPFIVWLADRWPWLRRIPARIVGVGFRPEHVQSGRSEGVYRHS